MGKPIPKTILVLLLAALLISPVLAVQVRELQWPDLVQKIEFEDPFEALSQEHLRELSIYARIEGLKKTSPDKVSQGMKDKAGLAEASLRAAGIDIEALLAKRSEIKVLRSKRGQAVDPELNGAYVRMPGFALPLEYSDKKITEFLLVPWVGACIHTPPPPPNQIIFVTVSEGFESMGQFAPVWVSGEIKVKPSTRDLYLVDGSAGIDTGYTLIASEVTAYKPQ